MHEYVEFWIEHPPDGVGKPRIPLMIKKEIYDADYASWMHFHDKKRLSYKWFCGIWRVEFGMYRMTDKRRFTMCSKCGAFNCAFFLTRDQEEKHQLLLVKSAHMEEVRNVRRIATFWHALAKQNPADYLFVIMDGMDSNKTAIPRKGRYVVPYVEEITIS